MQAATPYLAKFQDEKLRLKTFARYNGDCDVLKISKCGFFLKNSNEICCFHCGVSFFDFCSNTDFLTTHLKLNPRCAYLQENLSSREWRNIVKRSTYLKPTTYYVREKAPFDADYVDCFSRLESLKNQTEKLHSKKKFARAGFFYSPSNFKNILTCFECGLNIHSEIEENPWKVHCQFSPRCRYLLMSRGFFYVQKHTNI